MGPLFLILRDASRLVLQACELLEILPGKVRFVYWSHYVKGEVTNSGNAEEDTRKMMSIPFDGKSSFGKIEVPLPS